MQWNSLRLCRPQVRYFVIEVAEVIVVVAKAMKIEEAKQSIVWRSLLLCCVFFS